MQKPFTHAFKNKNPFKLEVAETRALTDSVNAVRLSLIRKELAGLLDKETVACILATD